MTSETHLIDCMEFMAKKPDNYYDLACPDIPYGIDVANMPYLREINTTVKQKNGTRLNGNNNKKVHDFKDWDKMPPPQEYFDELKRVSKHQIIFGVEYVNWSGLGTGRIKWNKGMEEGMSFKNYEMAYCSFVDHEIKLDLLWAGYCQAKSLKEPMTQQGNKKLNEKRIHPCHKPRLLYKWIYQNFTKQGDKVFDSHVGGQSSRIEAYIAKLNFESCELDPDYFRDGNQRFEDFKMQFEQEIGVEKVLKGQARLF